MEHLATTLFGKTRRQVLSRLFLEPQRAFRLRELVRRRAPVEDRIGREISPRLFSEKEYRERLGRGDRFLSTVMAGPRIAVLGNTDDAR